MIKVTGLIEAVPTGPEDPVDIKNKVAGAHLMSLYVPEDECDFAWLLTEHFYATVPMRNLDNYDVSARVQAWVREPTGRTPAYRTGT